MYPDQFRYRVHFQDDTKGICIVEAEAPIDARHLRAFIAKTRRVFELADDGEIRVIELRRVTERRDITRDILNETSQPDRMDLIRRILDEHDRGEVSPMESYRTAQSLFNYDPFGPESDEEQIG